MITVGNNKISDGYVGHKKVRKIYKGDELIFSVDISESPTPLAEEPYFIRSTSLKHTTITKHS